MNIEKLRELIEQKADGLSYKEIKIDGIKTEKDVDQLIELLSRDLKIDDLSINVDDEVSEYFISKFINMEPKPKINNELALPKIKLSHINWQIFFKGLPGFKGLKSLNLENSNLDYSNDLEYLGEYIAGNPTLEEINLCSDQKAGDKTFHSGSNANKLLGYLKTNTNLISITYGHEFDKDFNPNLSNEIRQKLGENAINAIEVSLNKKVISESATKSATKLKNDAHLQEVRENLERLIINSINDSLLKGTKNENKIQLYPNSLPQSISDLYWALVDLKKDLEAAMQDEKFSSDQADKINGLINYYSSQYRLINALNKMYQQESKASSHDKPILHNLREDFLKNWQTVATTKDVNDKNNKMSKLIQRTSKECELASSRVTDKTSGALIKNVLLILSAIFTAGISLGIYAAVTKQSQTERGSFFFKDTQLSKNKIDEVKESLQEVQNNLK